MTATPHCDRFLRDVKPSPLTTEDRKRIHHLLHALACNYVDVPEVVYEAADTTRKLSESDRLSWKNYLVQVVPSAGQVVWTLGHADGLLKMSPTSKERGRTYWCLFDPSDLLTAIDDTVALWRSGRLVEDVVTTKDPEPTKHTDPEPPMTKQPKPSLYDQIADLRLANLDTPWDPARVFANTEEAKANMTAAIEAMADPWYQPFSRKDFILRGPVEQTDARKAILYFAIDVDALDLDRDCHGDVIYNVPNLSTFYSKVRTRLAQRKAIWRRDEA